MLRLTNDDEIDCDGFAELVPAYLDGAIEAPHLRALIEHHRAIYAECAEEIALLERALETLGPRVDCDPPEATEQDRRHG